MPSTPMASRASLTASSFDGWITASIFCIICPSSIQAADVHDFYLRKSLIVVGMSATEKDLYLFGNLESSGKNQAKVREVTFGYEQPEGLILTSLDFAVNWIRKSSVWPMTFGLACCAIEMMSMGGARFDIARFGAEVFRPSPRQSDLMVIAGRVSQKMAPVIRRLWEQMPEPQWGSSVCARASSGAALSNYAILQGVNQIIPVDVYVP